MSMWDSISRLVKDPPPGHVFELSPAGVAYAHGAETGFAPLPEGALEVSPVENNVRQVDAITPVLGQFATVRSTTRGARRRNAAVLLPDACARVSVLDFDAFPEAAAEQAAHRVAGLVIGKGKPSQILAPARHDPSRLYRARLLHFTAKGAQAACTELHRKGIACSVVHPGGLKLASG